MEIKIIEKQNPLFNRREIVFEVEKEITPTRNEAEKIIANHFKTKEENIKLKKVEGRFGSNTFKIIANIYESREDKEAVEKKKKWELERDKKAAEDAKAKPAEAVEQAPVEEAKQEEKIEGET